MKKLLAGLVFTIILIIPRAQTLTTSWAIQNGCADYADDRGYSVYIDNSGNVYATGRFGDSTDFDPGAGTYFMGTSMMFGYYIEKLDPAGNLLWATKLSDTMGGAWFDEYERILTVDPSGNVIIGSPINGGNAGMTKLDANGNEVWTSLFTLTGGWGGIVSIHADQNGNIYCVGSYNGTIDVDPGSGNTNFAAANQASDMFVSKYDPSGNLIWAKQFAGAPYDGLNARDIDVDPFGNIFVSGNFSGPVDFDPGTGNVTYTGAEYDLFILKLDGNGNYQWAHHFPVESTGDHYNYLSLDPAGNVFITGLFNQPVDFDPGTGVNSLSPNSSFSSDLFILKLDASGNFQFAKQITPTSTLACNSSFCDAAGYFYFAGYYSGSVDFDPGAGVDTHTVSNPHLFIEKLDPAGNFEWVHRIKGQGWQTWPQSVSMNQSGTIAATGSFEDTLFTSPGTPDLIAYSGQDAFIMTLNGNVVSTHENLTTLNMAVYPNPVSSADRIILDFGEIIPSGSMEMLGTDGKVVFATEIRNQDQLFIQPDVPAGLYLIRVSGSEKPMVSKIFVK